MHFIQIFPEILLNTEILQDILEVLHSLEEETGGLHQPSTENLLRAVFIAPHPVKKRPHSLQAKELPAFLCRKKSLELDTQKSRAFIGEENEIGWAKALSMSHMKTSY